MILQIILQSRLPHFGQQDEAGSVGSGTGSGRNHHFVAQIPAHHLNLVNQLLGSGMLIRIAAFVPPVLQNLALRELLLEDLVGLLKSVSKIGNADIKDSIRRKQRKDFALIPRTGRLDLLQLLTQF